MLLGVEHYVFDLVYYFDDLYFDFVVHYALVVVDFGYHHNADCLCDRVLDDCLVVFYAQPALLHALLVPL